MTEQRRVIARVLSGCRRPSGRRAAASPGDQDRFQHFRWRRSTGRCAFSRRPAFWSGTTSATVAPPRRAPEDHHDHLIDIPAGHVIEFTNEEIERLQQKVAENLGYKLIGHRLELYATPLAAKAGAKKK